MTKVAESSDPADAPVRRSVTVDADVATAFRIFTDDIDGWWPRSHHIGTSPMKKMLVEPHAGGRCYTQQEDGTDCDWGTVLAWDPPRRVAFAWQINPDWTFQPDLAQSSEVEVTFTGAGANRTRIDLEHRHFERHGAGAESMRTSVDDPNGWDGLLSLYTTRAERVASTARA
jgi:uncharacterized protein YndB with AHSA1/START domain